MTMMMIDSTSKHVMYAQAKREGLGFESKDGRWAIDEQERDRYDLAAEKTEQFEETLKTKQEWLNPLSLPESITDSLHPGKAYWPFGNMHVLICLTCSNSTKSKLTRSFSDSSSHRCYQPL